MQYLLNCSQMKRADRFTIEEIGVPSMVLMERAALAVAEEMLNAGCAQERILAVCGMGNNGGDGLAIARLLYLKGCKVFVECVGNPDKMTAETRQQYKIVKNYQIPIVNNPDYREYTTIVDALFGVGITRQVEGIYRQKIQAVNDSGARIWSVDIPSGVDGDTGRVLGAAIRANETITFAFGKIGHVLYPGRACAGHLLVKDIGIYPVANEEDAYMRSLEPEDCKELLKRDPAGHKGTFGKILVLAGSRGMSGAAYFAGRAAYAAGAGMVKICTTQENRQILQTLVPEALYGTWDKEELERGMEWCDAVVIGPGIGQDMEAFHMLEHILELGRRKNLPMVLDADGLNLLSAHRELRDMLYEKCVYTPHMLELSRMTGKTVEGLRENPVGTAAQFAQDYPGTLVWKDACTLVKCSQGRVYLNQSGNDGMATAGAGDVLAGLIGGLLATGLKPDAAASLGVYLHGRAGDYAAARKGRHGMTARDILEEIAQAIRESI